MAFGVQITNNANRVQIDQDFKNARLIQSGSHGTSAPVIIELAYDITDDPPLVLIRPSLAEKYVGACSCRAPVGAFGSNPARPNGYITLAGQCPFDYAVFSPTLGTPVSDGSTWGLEVLRSDGSIAYTSKHRHPRISHLLYRAAASGGAGGFPATFTISGYSQMPWFLANPLLVTFAGVGELSESVGCIMAKINSAFTTVTVDMRDWADDTYPVFPSLADRAAYNPYNGHPGWFGVADYA